ncbi:MULTISPECIES: cytochrome d ubiquinol oxidase subunit II [Exiguobacterium]|uniref:cytochrome d ubiquinol oxidase subunit II n=1 Tax=Exiguobacterium TaxID=33986 RepID=UPI000453499E|nr:MULTISPECIES: cytochrome d ubiquinol oxidase subunit II [unclassified Exiguobacterium]EZP60686.1 cytochrome oxidase subunit II [Exiguobacterium sp. RIT341]KQS40249.1 cytochrome D ubiquinol oxidase subunit II [Exiguobacterium sp. Leaf196]HBF59877.1 cytochrome D ubiquinol oxidase subunit II [Exiguobacterium sp.]HCV52864.1 cytochrome D ubiquinol oxidase subunit II [Exiguobacterium sp.]
MDVQTLGITVLWTFLYGYLIVASIDFGAGFYAFYSKYTKRDHLTNRLILRYLSPVWEVTNVFFVFFFVGLVGFFPDSAYYFGTALLVPASIVLVLIAIRGSFYAFANYGSNDSMFYTFLYGATGLLIPAAMSTTLTISQGGFIRKTNDTVEFLGTKLFSNFYSWTVVALAIVSVLYISAMFLLFYADKAKDEGATPLIRKWALFWSGPTILVCALVFFGLKNQAAWHYENILNGNWWWFAASFLFFLIAVTLVYMKKNYGIAFVAVMLQYAVAWFGYGYTHLPYILYPYIDINKAVVNETMASALVVVFIFGLLLLIPALYLILRLFLFDNDYVRGKSSK